MDTPDAPSISVPVASTSPSPVAASSHRWRLLDWLLVVGVLVFAFLAASFAVRNSDFWMHLAGGRLLAEGRYQFGVDPFAYTTQDVYWANHAWLFDLLLYLLHQYFGGGVLVVLKALLIALLAAVLLRVRRPGSGVGLPAACTMLAVLAMSPRLLLHSTCLSYVFLGVALWLLWRPRVGASASRGNRRQYTPLLLLFVLWVNVDSWFLLGPLLAFLFWMGEHFHERRSVSDGMRRTPAWLAPAGLAVCLLNPHLWHAFALPMDLMPLPVELRHDPRFQGLSISPWRLGLLYQPASGVNLAHAAFCLLLALGAVSFMGSAGRPVGWRLLVWLSFAALAASAARGIPFFAVVAAPITALNFQDALAARAETRSRKAQLLFRAAPFLLLLSSGVLIGLTWLGWLRGFPMAGRGVEWAVHPDASLRRVAETLHRWHQEGTLRDGDRGFLFHPALVPYCAWFCPEEKGFLDHRLSLFRGVAGEYEEICRALNPALDPQRNPGSDDGRSVLRAHRITHLILYDPQLPRLDPVLEKLALEERDWTLLHVDGQALIVGWRDGDRTLPDGVPAFDPDRLAFLSAGSDEDSALPPAPGRGPERGPRPADLWTQLGSPIAPSPWETDAAAVLLRYFEDRVPRQGQRRAAHCLGWEAALLGLLALPAGSVDGAIRLAVHLHRMPSAPGDLRQQPPALLLLAIRAARRALADNPDDANAYLCLGRAYLLLAGMTPERRVLGTFQLLDHLRHIQIAVALENALRRKPDLLPAHQYLADFYEGRNFLDAALDHRREVLRLTQRDGPRIGETAEAFAHRLDQLGNHNRELERRVGDLKNEFALQSQKVSAEPYRKARLALRMGLARLALDDVLMQAPMVLLGSEGIALQVELQLMLGQSESVRAQLHDADWQTNKANLGFVDMPAPPSAGTAPSYRLPAYEWLLLCTAAAVGDYEEAAAAIQQMLAQLEEQGAVRVMTRLQHELPRTLALELALSAARYSGLPRRLVKDRRLEWTGLLNSGSALAVEYADLHMLSGMLSLERGDPGSAATSFTTALTLVRLVASGPHASAGEPLALAYQQILWAARR